MSCLICSQVPHSTGPNTEILLTLEPESYTIYFDMGRKFGHACVQSNCIADMHTLNFAKTGMYLRKPS